MKLLFATNNAHKLDEARQILGSDYEVLSLADVGFHDEIPETSDTIAGNAEQKARHIAALYPYPVIADDTGLLVEALGDAPGVHTARYAGPQCNPADNIAKLLHELQGQENRNARFVTVIAYINAGELRLFEGEVRGKITQKPEGEGGFGYDPVFAPVETGIPFALMPAEEKNAISHRGRALRKFAAALAIK